MFDLTRVAALLATLAFSACVMGAPAKGGGSTDSDPVLSFAADAQTVPYGSSVRLSWASANAKFCDADGQWSGRKADSGTERIDAIRADSLFSLTCRNGNRRVTGTVTVRVDSSTLPAPAPTVQLRADMTSVTAGDYVNLNWLATDATSCNADLGWTGPKGTSGTEKIGPMQQSSTFRLTCDGAGGSAAASVSVAVNEPVTDPAPTVVLDADASVVPYGGSAMLKWSSSDATGCLASGGWSGTKATSGTESTGSMTGSKTFSLKCDGAGGSAYSVVTINVQDSQSVDVTSPGTIGDGRLEAIVAALQQKYGIPALAAVVTRNGQIAEAAASGVRYLGSNEPVTLEDQWHLGSVTKGITGTLVATQVEAGVLTWQTKPSDVWPNLSMRSEYRDVTLFDLLTHQSGLPNREFDVPSISKIYDSAPGTVREKRLLLSDELLDLAPATSRGTFYYSNAGYIIAAAMIETLTDTSWDQLMRTYLLDPLGMGRTGYGAPGPNEPYGHRTTSTGLEPVPPGPGADIPLAMSPAYGMHTTQADYAAFMLDHIAGALGYNGVVSASMYDFLHARHASNGYGIGWYAWQNGLIEHSGTNNKWRARARAIPYLNVGILVTTNANNTNAQEASTVLRELLTDRAKATP